MLWDLKEGKRLYSLDAGDIIHSLVFSPNRYWLCAATTAGIKVRRLRDCRRKVFVTVYSAMSNKNIMQGIPWLVHTISLNASCQIVI